MSNTFSGYRIATSPCHKEESVDDNLPNPISSRPSNLLSMTYPSPRSKGSSVRAMLQNDESSTFETVPPKDPPSSSLATSLSTRPSSASDVDFEIYIKKKTKKKTTSKEDRKRSTSKEERKSKEGRKRSTSKEERKRSTSEEVRKRSRRKEDRKRSTSEEVRRRGTSKEGRRRGTSKEERKRSTSKEERRRTSKSKRHSRNDLNDGAEIERRRSSRIDREERKSRKIIEDHDLITEYLVAAQKETATEATNGDIMGAAGGAAAAAEDANVDRTATGVIRTLVDQPVQPRQAARHNMMLYSRQETSSKTKLTDYERFQKMLNGQSDFFATAEDTSGASPSCDTLESGRDRTLHLLDSSERVETVIQNSNVSPPRPSPGHTQAQQYGIGVPVEDFFAHEFNDEIFEEAFDDFSKHYLSLSPWTDGDKADDKFGKKDIGKKGSSDFDFEPVARSTAMPRLGRPAQTDELTGMNYQVLKTTQPTIARLPPPGTSDRARMPMTTMSTPDFPIVMDIETIEAADIAPQRNQSIPPASSDGCRRVDVAPISTRRYPHARPPSTVAMVGRAFGNWIRRRFFRKAVDRRKGEVDHCD